MILGLAGLVACIPAPAAAQASRMPIVADNIVVQRDVIYGRPDGAAVLADIAYPEAGKGLPAMIYVHGGRWTSGERVGRLQLYVEDWAKAGYFAMTIDYRLAGSAPAPAGYQDLLCAIRWLHAHAAKYGVDPDRIYLSGNSSGGHVVALAATIGDGPYERVGGWKDARSDVRAVISIAGAYDLNTLSWGNLWAPLNAKDPKDLEKARRIASPLHQITANTKPMLIIHSDDDQSVPVQQAVDMTAALAKAGIKHKFVRYKDRGHMRLTDEVVNEMLAFIGDVEGRVKDTK
ncbi:MAG TPA: alpha/beta hydrolase fold domain-containing protein [Vicinamibacterales bacterium]